MFSNKKYIKFLQKSKSINSDILCISILEKNDTKFKKSQKTMFINSEYETIGFGANIELKNFVFTYYHDILQNKKGKFLAYKKSIEDKTIYCWVEPFYSLDNYGYLGIALNNALKGMKSTLIRSTKFSGAHSFVSNFNENKNSFSESKNLFYEEITTPTKALVLGATKGYVELVKSVELLGWQTTLCDLKGNSLKKIKLLDEIVLLNHVLNVSKLFNKNFDVALIIDNDSTSLRYLQEVLESKIPNILVFKSTRESEKIVINHNIKHSIIDDRVKLIKMNEFDSMEKVTYKTCYETEKKMKNKGVLEYEFI